MSGLPVSRYRALSRVRVDRPSTPENPLPGMGGCVFWANFALACAMVAPPLRWPAGAAGVALSAWVFREAGRVRSSRTGDDVDFVQFFTLGQVLLCAASIWLSSKLLWFVFLLGVMFHLHCIRNLSIEVARDLRGEPSSSGEEEDEDSWNEDLDPLAILDSKDPTSLFGDPPGQPHTQPSEPDGEDLPWPRILTYRQRRFLLLSRARLHLGTGLRSDPRALEAEKNIVEEALRDESDPEMREARRRHLASLQRLERTLSAPEEARTVLIGVLHLLRSAECDFSGDVAGLGELERALDQIERSLAAFEDSPEDMQT